MGVVSTGSISPFLDNHSSCVLATSLFPGVWDPPVTIPSSSSPPATYFYSISWHFVPLSSPLQYLILPPTYFLPFLDQSQVLLSLHLPRSSCSPPQCRTEASTYPDLFLQSSIWSVGCLMGIVSFLSNTQLSVSTCHVCSFVTGLPHSG